MPLVSIITPLFNRAHLLKETWESIKGQTYTNWEWIVVDDGSTDISVELMHEISQSDNRVKLFIRPLELRKGPSSCRNYGVKISNGEYLIFLDSDDLLSKNCLEQRVSLISEKVNLDFAIFSMGRFIKAPGDTNEVFNMVLNNRETYLKYFLSDNPPWTVTSPIWKKYSFQKLGGFNENYKCMEDPELHVRALISDYNFEVIKSEPDCFYRNSFNENQNQNNFWRNSIEGRISFIKNVYSCLDQNIESEAQKQLYISYLSQFYFSLIKGFILARLHGYQNEFIEISKWVRQKEIISRIQYIKMKLAYRIYLSESKLITILHLRGIAYRLI